MSRTWGVPEQGGHRLPGTPAPPRHPDEPVFQRYARHCRDAQVTIAVALCVLVIVAMILGVIYAMPAPR
jgi:hypothetical protein